MKFKVGDKVRVVGQSAELEHCYEIGEVVTVEKSDCGDKDCRCISESGLAQYVNWSCLEAIETPEFKVGDKVRVIGNGNGCDSIRHHFDIGEELTVESVCDFGEYCWCVNKDGKHQSVSYCHLEAKSAEAWKIEIIPDGESTTATLFKNGNAVKSATVKRYKEDEYSIRSAADYAVKKLFEKQKEKEWKVGARVVGNGIPTGKDITGKKGRIVEVDGFSIGVEFDERISGHSCCGAGKDRHCWYCDKTDLKLL